MQRGLSLLIYGLTSLIGIAAFLYPFWLPTLQQGAVMGRAHADDAPLLLTGLVGLSLAVLLLEIQNQTVSPKIIALLGVLVAMNAILRFAEVAVPGPGGFSPTFLLIILTGYAYGGRLGFLMGALTLLVSAMITGTVGPWLPYQMFAAGWIGLSAPLCRPTVWLLGVEDRWLEAAVLAAFGGFWGLTYGVIMNIWFWPYAAGPADLYWQPGISLLEILQRYATFYVVTSMAWDSMRALGNVLLLLTMGQPVLRVLRRFRHRFTFDYRPEPGLTSGGRP